MSYLVHFRLLFRILNVREVLTQIEDLFNHNITPAAINKVQNFLSELAGSTNQNSAQLESFLEQQCDNNASVTVKLQQMQTQFSSQIEKIKEQFEVDRENFRNQIAEVKTLLKLSEQNVPVLPVSLAEPQHLAPIPSILIEVTKFKF